uniref:VWFA domain-containing protein n=1 Tax=Panagrolaimus superbus TaxID=310955 RepID=A0A914Z857_9BILA
MVGNLTDFQKQIKFITDKLISNWVINPNTSEVAALLYNTQTPKVIGRPFLYYNVKTLILDLQDQLQSFTYFQSDISFGISTLKENLQNRRSNISMINTAICEPSDPPKPTVFTTTTQFPTITTPASLAPYSPCQKFIAFIIDVSNDLTDGQFAMQKGAVGLGLPDATHYERFAFGYYASTGNVFDFGRFNSNEAFTDAIAGTKQTNNPPNITRALQAADIGLTVNNTINMATIIFITKSDPADIAAAIPFAQSLQSKGKLTVVALLNANLTLLRQLTPNIVTWSDMGFYNTTAWIPEMRNAFGCSTPGGPYWPCQSDIVLAVDVSSSMSDEVFRTEGLFIVILLVNYNWSHYERVGLMSYADGYNRVWKYDTFNNDSTINNPILQMSQQNGKNNITEGFLTLISSFSQGHNAFRNTIFFTTGSDPIDITMAQPLATQISLKGPLIIIAYGENANVVELQRLNPTKIVYINPSGFAGGYQNSTASEEIYSVFQCN